MSKSPNLLIPGISIVALMLGLGYGFSARNYGDDKISMLEDRLGQVEAQASEAGQTASAEAARVAELQAMIAEVQAAAEERASMAASLTSPAPEMEGSLGLGRPALPEEIAAWDVDVLPDGRGLPEGKGDVWTGEEVFADQCASCHGDFAEGVDNWPVLAGGFDTLGDKDPVKTVGSYWPHLSTVWDYIHRSMPFGAAGTLSADETYAIVAYILYSNDMVDDDFELSHENFAAFEMHNAEGFVIDDRTDLEYALWRTEPCMENCKEAVEVTMRSVFLVETPPEGGSDSVMNHETIEGLPSFTAAGPSFIPEATSVAAPSATEVAAAPSDTEDDGTALVTAGAKVFKKCAACHAVGDGAKSKTGPHLNALFGRAMGGLDGFKYSKVFQAALKEGRVWDEASLTAFLEKPKAYMKGTKMAFAGLRKEADIIALTAYLKSYAE